MAANERREISVGLIGPLPPPAGGMANQTRQLKELLEGEGLAVSLVQVNAPYQPAWIGRVPVARAFFRLIPYLISLWRVAGRVDLFHVMANSGWSWFLFAAPAVRIGHFRGIPVVVNYRGGEAESFLNRSAARVLPTLRRASVLAVPSGFLRDVFAKFGATAEIVPNIVNLERFAAQADPPPGPPCIMVARNLEPIYDIATAIRAFAQVHASFPTATLVVAGSGPDRAMLEQLTAELGLGSQVTFTGRLDRDGMAELYRSAHIALNPSKVDNMPNSVLEAYASGVPVVSTQVGGVPYIVTEGVTGLMVPPSDPNAMAAALLRLLRDPELALTLRRAGPQEAQKYSWTAVRGTLLSLYRRLL